MFRMHSPIPRRLLSLRAFETRISVSIGRRHHLRLSLFELCSNPGVSAQAHNKSLQRTAGHKVQSMKPKQFNQTVSGVGSLRRAGAELNR